MNESRDILLLFLSTQDPWSQYDNDVIVTQVIAVLNRENEVSTDVDSDDEEEDEEIDPDKLTLDRLKLALKYEQKQVRATKILVI